MKTKPVIKDVGLWTLEYYVQRMTVAQWRGLILADNDTVLRHGRVPTIGSQKPGSWCRCSQQVTPDKGEALMYEVKVIRDGEVYKFKFADLESALAFIQGYNDTATLGENASYWEFNLARVPEKEPVKTEEYDELLRNAAVRWLTGVYLVTFNDEADVVDDETTLPHLVEALQGDAPKVFQAIMDEGAYKLVNESEYFERFVR